MWKREGGETREKRTKEGTGKFDKIHSDSLKKCRHKQSQLLKIIWSLNKHRGFYRKCCKLWSVLPKCISFEFSLCYHSFFLNLLHSYKKENGTLFYENPFTLIRNSITRNRTRKSWNDKEKRDNDRKGGDCSRGRKEVRGHRLRNFTQH